MTDDLNILIAGCGTQQATQVARTPNARIVATHISDNSLAETNRLADRIDTKNLTLKNVPLKRL